MFEFSFNTLWELYHQFWYAVPIGIIGIISWTVWLVRWSMSRCYRPLVNNFRTTTSVVVPSYREDPDVLVRCLNTWLAEAPDEIIIVVDSDDTAVIERLRTYSDPRLRVIVFKHHGKRSALGVGIRAAQYDVVVLCDSDTAWETGLLASLQMPFIDPRVGGVGTRQNAFERQSSIWRVVADWLVNIRYLDYVPACSMAGGVACLSGRTAAYRRSVIVPLLPQLEHEYFMGRLCVAGDDGRLTWLVLGSGYRTVYQSSARAWSMFPATWQAFVKQRIRWSRNSYRCYLTAIRNGWLWQQPLITQVTVLQILLTPLSMGFAISYLLLATFKASWGLLLFSLLWVLAGRALRGVSHLREHPRDLLALPLVALVTIVIALPIKAWAALTMNTHGWLTRQHSRIGGEGQTEASLYGHTPFELRSVVEQPFKERQVGG
jgi:cellulose synthase/poly-beta-1,6-N-acetylglucosamine synthase-like glycosyltransferase